MHTHDAEQLVALVQCLSSSSYVHGDLRPQNVLVYLNEKMQVIDFDWAGRESMKLDIHGRSLDSRD